MAIFFRPCSFFSAIIVLGACIALPASAQGKSNAQALDEQIHSGKAVASGMLASSASEKNKPGKSEKSGKDPQASPPRFIEEQLGSGKILLRLDAGEAMLKMVTCLQVRLPGFPVLGILDMAKESALSAMRTKNGAQYFPDDILNLNCADSDFERFFDNRKIASTATWQKFLKMYQDLPGTPNGAKGEESEDAEETPDEGSSGG